MKEPDCAFTREAATDAIVGAPPEGLHGFTECLKVLVALGRLRTKTIDLTDTSDFCLVEGICQL